MLTTIHFGASSFRDLRSFRLQSLCGCVASCTDNVRLSELLFDDNCCVGDARNKEGRATKEPWDFLNTAVFSGRRGKEE